MSDEPKAWRANDGLDFNDPDAWAYCPWCAFAVAVAGGVIIEHRRIRNGHDTAMCTGGGRLGVLPIPLTGSPLQTTSLRKETGRANRRAYWQRQRWGARRLARKKLALKLGQPNKVTVTSMATGEEIDITDTIIGPVYLNVEEDDGDEERDRP